MTAPPDPMAGGALFVYVVVYAVVASPGSAVGVVQGFQVR